MAAALLALSTLVPLAPAAASGPRPGERYVVMLKDEAGDPGRVANEHARDHKAEVRFVYRSALRGYSAVIPSDRVAAVRADRRVAFLTPDLPVTVLAESPPALPTGVDRIDAENRVEKGSGVGVAVLDTGVDLDHPDLAANLAGSKDCIDADGTGDDGHGHGTHVAGTIAALRNDVGVVGVAPEARLWAVKVLNESGSGSFSTLICGVDFVDSLSPAKGGPIAVANMSLGGRYDSPGSCGGNKDALHAAICRAAADGVTFVAAAGNSSADLRYFVPASYPEVIAASALADSEGEPCGVGAATLYGSDDTFASFSNFATRPDDLGRLVAAPGVSILSTYKAGAYRVMSGTSMASPHVAGGAALHLARNPGATPPMVLEALKASAEPRGENYNQECPTGVPSHTDPSGRHPERVLRVQAVKDTSPPSAPTGLTGAATGSTSVALSWGSSTDDMGVARYEVYRDGAKVGAATATSYTDTGLSPSSTYAYAVRGVDEAGNTSLPSDTVSVSTPPDREAPSPPTDLSGTAVSPSEIALRWSASIDDVGVAGYFVHRDAARVATVTVGTTHSDRGLRSGTTYRYVVAAFDASGNVSAPSNEISVRTRCSQEVAGICVVP